MARPACLALTAELVHLRIDVLVTYGTPATRAAKQATTSVPARKVQRKLSNGVPGFAAADDLLIKRNFSATLNKWPTSLQSAC
jgi:hypothetical protein